jgi:D-sedoheptulose 7-phosphate isomerase
MLSDLIERYPALSACRTAIEEVYETLCAAFAEGKKLLVAGNGGSAADADHIVGELAKGFLKKRPLTDEFKEAIRKMCGTNRLPGRVAGEILTENLQQGLPVISLSAHTALLTATVNDIGQIGDDFSGGWFIYAQALMAYGAPGDVFLGISTSGNSLNVCGAGIVAQAKGLKTIALTGGEGGALAALCDTAIIAPASETYKIQELHLPIYHALCMMVEERFFGD